jgi:hypothetical protein
MSSTSRHKLSTRWQRFRSQPYLFWPSFFLAGLTALVLLFFAAIQLGADFGTIQDQLYMRGLARPFQPQQEGEILLVITHFDTNDETRQSPIPEALKAAIEEQASALDPVKPIPTKAEPNP